MSGDKRLAATLAPSRHFAGRSAVHRRAGLERTHSWQSGRRQSQIRSAATPRAPTSADTRGRGLGAEVPAPARAGVALTPPGGSSTGFTSAATEAATEVTDPAAWCGEIQPTLDWDAARAALLDAAHITRIVDAEQRGTMT
jgi:hypothetical protein